MARGLHPGISEVGEYPLHNPPNWMQRRLQPRSAVTTQTTEQRLCNRTGFSAFIGVAPRDWGQGEAK